MPLELAAVLSGGMNLYLHLTLGHDGSTDESAFAFLDWSGGWLKSRRPWLEGAESVHDVGIVLGTAEPGDLDWPGGSDDYAPTIVKLEESLRANNYLPRRFLNCRHAVEWGEFSAGVRALIVPDRVSLTPQDTARVERFVRGGGKLIAFGRGTSLAKSGSEAEAAPLFGVRAMGEARINRGVIEWSGRKTPLKTPLLHLRPGSAEVVLWAGSPATGVVPALTRNEAGTGAAYAFALPESTVLEEPEMLNFLWKQIIGEPVYQAGETSGRYIIRVRRQKGRHILHVLDNMEAPSARGNWDRYRPGYVELRINTSLLPFEKALLAPDNRPLPGSASGHWMTFKVYPNPEMMIALQ
jgi:hypothetical protein